MLSLVKILEVTGLKKILFNARLQITNEKDLRTNK